MLLKVEMWYTVQEPHTCLLLRLSATLAMSYKDPHSECAKKTPIGQEIHQCVRVGLVLWYISSKFKMHMLANILVIYSLTYVSVHQLLKSSIKNPQSITDIYIYMYGPKQL